MAPAVDEQTRSLNRNRLFLSGVPSANDTVSMAGLLTDRSERFRHARSFKRLNRFLSAVYSSGLVILRLVKIEQRMLASVRRTPISVTVVGKVWKIERREGVEACF